MAAVTALARIAAGIFVVTNICLSPVVDLSVHREAHSCYFGFQTPSVTAYGTKEASIRDYQPRTDEADWVRYCGELAKRRCVGNRDQGRSELRRAGASSRPVTSASGGAV